MKWYILIKKYPGSPEVGEIYNSNQLPGHQWPEYWREMGEKEIDLRAAKKNIEGQLYIINKEIAEYENKQNKKQEG